MSWSTEACYTCDRYVAEGSVCRTERKDVPLGTPYAACTHWRPKEKVDAHEVEGGDPEGQEVS